MPKVTGPCFSLDAQKSLRKTLTFQRRPSGHAVYPWRQPGGREPFSYSPAQLAQRISVKNLVAAWRALDSNYREQWDDLAKEMGELGTGYHLYLKLKGANPTIIYGLDLDGSDDYVLAPDNDTDFDALEEITIECWINAHESKTQGIVDHNRFDAWNIHWAANDVLRFEGGAKLADSALNALSANTPLHLAATYDGSTITLYVNGAVSGTPVAASGALGSASTGLYIGRLHDGVNFHGNIYEVRIWKKGLNAADIFKHSRNFRDISFDNTPGVGLSDLIVHYKMLAGSGTKLSDFSGHKNDGAFKGTNEPKWIQNDLFRDLYGIT